MNENNEPNIKLVLKTNSNVRGFTPQDPSPLPQQPLAHNTIEDSPITSSYINQETHNDGPASVSFQVPIAPTSMPLPPTSGPMAPPSSFPPPAVPAKRLPGRPPKTRGETAPRGEVRFYVGAEKKQWDLTEKDIYNRVPLFRDFFEEGFKKGREKIMRLPAEDTVTFAKFIGWLASGSISCSYCGQRDAAEGSDPKRFEAMHELSWCHLWVMADKFGLDDLALEAIRQLVNCLWIRTKASPEVFVSKKAVDFVFENSVGGTGLRKVMAREVAHYHLSDIEGKDGFTRLEEYHCGDEEMKAEFEAAAWQHVQISHMCCAAHWRVPLGCCYSEEIVPRY